MGAQELEASGVSQRKGFNRDTEVLHGNSWRQEVKTVISTRIEFLK